jgi:hypothetical protein
VQHNNSPVGADLQNGEFCFYYNTANAFVNIRVKDAAGTVKTGQIAVA